jgi:23S rRNA (cytosine1962-C5)-methyltransferase
VVEEHGLRFAVSVARGQKTGFYLDQRTNRGLVREHAEGREVLDCFCYSGGFALNALAGGASSVLALESSADALQAARRNAQANASAPERVHWLEADAFQALRRLRDQARTFDLIVLDPPKFAPTAALAERAARAYKDINLLAFKLLRPGGLLFTFSCSGGMPRELFQKVVAGAALDAGVHAQIVRHLDAAPDHPVALEFPEGEYLKGLLCRVAG